MNKEQSNITDKKSFTSKSYEKLGIHITVNLPCLSETQRTNADIQIKDRITETVRHSMRF